MPKRIVAANGKRRRMLAALAQSAQLQSDTEAALDMQRAKRQLLGRIAKLSA